MNTSAGPRDIPQPSSPFRSVLLDDNADDRAYFRFLLRRHPSIQLAGEATNLRDALDVATREQAKVLFLETQLGGESIFDACPLIPPSVQLIFITGNESEARRAFDLDALDFLVKPLDADRLAETVRRLLRIEWHRPEDKTGESATMLVPFERGRRGTSIDEINMIQAIGNYTRLVLEDGTSEVVFRSLVKWAKILPSPPFLRIHRNTIVHGGKVRGLEKTDNGSVLRIENVNEPMPVSRRCMTEVRQALFQENA